MLQLVAATLLIQSDPWTEPVDFIALAEPVSKVVARLADIADRPLSVSDSLKDEIIIIHAKQQSPEALVKEIAWATMGTWQTRTQGSTLVSNRPTEAEIAQRNRAQREQNIKQGLTAHPYWPDREFSAISTRVGNDIADFFKTIGQVPSDREKSARNDALIREMQFNNPDNRLLIRIATALGSEQLAAIPPGRTLTLTTSGAPGTQKAPFDLTKSFLQAQNEWQLLLPFEDTSLPSLALQSMSNGLTYNVQPEDEFVVKLTGTESGIKISWNAVAEQGMRSTGYSDLELPSTYEARSNERQIQPPDLKSTFTPSPEAITNFRVLYQAPNVTDEEKLQVRSNFLDPEKRDPLQLYYAEALTTAAQELDRPLVAVIPDNKAVQTHIHINDLKAIIFLVYREGVELDFPSEGFWRVRPLAYQTGDLYRLPRTTIKEILNATPVNAKVDLNRLLDAYKSISANDISYLEPKLHNFVPITLTNQSNSKVALSTLANLTPNQRKQLLNSGKLPLAITSLQPIAQHHLLGSIEANWSALRMQPGLFPSRGRMVANNISQIPSIAFGNLTENQLLITYQKIQGVTVNQAPPTAFWPNMVALDDFVAILYPDNDPSKPEADKAEAFTVQEHHVFHIDLNNGRGKTLRWHAVFPVTTAEPKPETIDNPSQVVRNAIARRKAKGN